MGYIHQQETYALKSIHELMGREKGERHNIAPIPQMDPFTIPHILLMRKHKYLSPRIEYTLYGSRACSCSVGAF